MLNVGVNPWDLETLFYELARGAPPTWFSRFPKDVQDMVITQFADWIYCIDDHRELLRFDPLIGVVQSLGAIPSWTVAGVEYGGGGGGAGVMVRAAIQWQADTVLLVPRIALRNRPPAIRASRHLPLVVGDVHNKQVMWYPNVIWLSTTTNSGIHVCLDIHRWGPANVITLFVSQDLAEIRTFNLDLVLAAARLRTKSEATIIIPPLRAIWAAALLTPPFVTAAENCFAVLKRPPGVHVPGYLERLTSPRPYVYNSGPAGGPGDMDATDPDVIVWPYKAQPHEFVFQASQAVSPLPRLPLARRRRADFAECLVSSKPYFALPSSGAAQLNELYVYLGEGEIEPPARQIRVHGVSTVFNGREALLITDGNRAAYITTTDVLNFYASVETHALELVSSPAPYAKLEVGGFSDNNLIIRHGVIIRIRHVDVTRAILHFEVYGKVQSTVFPLFSLTDPLQNNWTRTRTANLNLRDTDVSSRQIVWRASGYAQ